MIINSFEVVELKFAFSELVEAMQDKDAGIALETHEVQDNKIYKHCFSGMYTT
jgi:hypothetical protein